MIVAAALIVDPNLNVLMTRRKLEGQCPGMWEYPGGKALPGETPEEAMVRELREELGVAVRPLSFVAGIPLDFGIPFTFELYHAEILEGTPQALVGQLEIDYVDPAYAVARLPCCPGNFVVFPYVRQFLQEL